MSDKTDKKSVTHSPRVLSLLPVLPGAGQSCCASIRKPVHIPPLQRNYSFSLPRAQRGGGSQSSCAPIRTPVPSFHANFRKIEGTK